MAKEEMVVVDAPPQPMVLDSQPSRDGEASAAATDATTTSGDKDMMEESEGEYEMQDGNPEFSKFMQGFWDLTSVDSGVRYLKSFQLSCLLRFTLK